MIPDAVTLIVDDIPHELPLVTETEGERAVDISRLCSTTDLVIFDDAYSNIGSCSSATTFIDGERDTLQYRGAPIENLAPRSFFIEVAELLIFGDFPDDDERNEPRQLLIGNSTLHCDTHEHFGGFPADAHPMTILSAMTNAIQAYDLLEICIMGEAGFRRVAVLLLVRTRTIVAVFYKSHIGQPIVYPHYDLPYAENLLYMMFTMSYRDYEATPGTARTLNMFLVLHVGCEQNCSISTMWMATSSDANLLTATSAGIAVLWGPLRDGANTGVIEMLEQIHNEGMSVGSYLAKAKDRRSGVRLMGSGHRVCRNSDPHARTLKKAAHDLLESMNVGDPLLDITREIEKVALADDYSAERRSYPNVGFYSDTVLRVIGIPLDMLTMLFAIGRTAGWTAHWKEVSDDPTQHICGPRQLYTGNELTKWLPLDER